jgi:NADH dehydrogenase|tara:strand:- start:3714 stop:4607 length:894 start_codon:yes stop_codon:yes gene_type:complete
MIAITGATGFIGKFVISNLKDRKIPFFCIAREKSDISYIKQLGIEIKIADITHYDSLKGSLRGANSVIHMAALLKSNDIKELEKVNIEGTKNIVKACESLRIKRIIFTSSDNAKGGKGPYGLSKRKAEDAVKKSTLNWTILRITDIYGEYNKKNLGFIKNLIKKSFFVPVIGWNCILQPVYVKDAVNAMISALNSKKTNKKMYYIAGKNRVKLSKYIQILSKAIKKKIIRIYIPIYLIFFPVWIQEKILRNPFITVSELNYLSNDHLFDISDNMRDFNYNPVDLEEGVKEMIAHEKS